MNTTELSKEDSIRIKPGSLKGGGASVSPMFITAMVTGIITLIIFIHIGFFDSYIKHFPKFKSFTGAFGPIDFNWIMHFHGMVMMGWVMMLLVQPILMRTGRKDLHRRVGRFSYVLAPLVVLSIYLANYDAYNRVLNAAGKSEAVAVLSLIFPALIFFTILYSLAMYYKHKPALHMRYICSTAFLFIPPALDRTLVHVFQLPGYDVGSIIQLAIIGSVVILDSIKTKRISPFLLVFSFELMHVSLWHLRTTNVWQTIGGAIANIF